MKPYLFAICAGLLIWASNLHADIALNSDAPSFSLPELKKGNLVSLADYKGKVVYLDFWASWCAPCRASFPAISRLHSKYKDLGLEVIAINLDDDVALAYDFLKTHPVNYRVVRGANSNVTKDFEIQAMPTAIFVDGEGRVRLIHKGFKRSHEAYLDAVLDKLIAEL